MQAVGADDQIEAPPTAAREGHIDPVGILGQVGDPVPEDVLDPVAGVVVKHLGEAPPQDLYLGDVPVPAVVVGSVGCQHLAVRVHGVRAGRIGACRPHGSVEPHPPDHLFRHPASVYRLPTGTQLGRLLDHGHLGPPPV